MLLCVAIIYVANNLERMSFSSKANLCQLRASLKAVIFLKLVSIYEFRRIAVPIGDHRLRADH